MNDLMCDVYKYRSHSRVTVGVRNERTQGPTTGGFGGFIKRSRGISGLFFWPAVSVGDKPALGLLNPITPSALSSKLSLFSIISTSFPPT